MYQYKGKQLKLKIINVLFYYDIISPTLINDYNKDFNYMVSYNLLTAITSRVATLISASSKGHVTIE